MFIWNARLKRFWIGLWRYLNQPLFDKSSKTTLEPWQFFHDDKVHFLEDCWELHYSSKEKQS